MAAKAAGECAHGGHGTHGAHAHGTHAAHAHAHSDDVYEPWEMTPREKELAAKYVKLIQGSFLYTNKFCLLLAKRFRKCIEEA